MSLFERVRGLNYDGGDDGGDSAVDTAAGVVVVGGGAAAAEDSPVDEPREAAARLGSRD